MSIEAMKQALEALETEHSAIYGTSQTARAITSLRQAIAEAEKQCTHRLVDVTNPVVKSGYMCMDCGALFGAYIQKPEAEKQEPVAWIFQHEETGRTMCVDAQQVEWGFEKGNPRLKKIAPLYTSPPQRQPLTDEQIEKCYETTGHYQTLRPQDRFAVFALARAIEAAHGIKENNNG